MKTIRLNTLEFTFCQLYVCVKTNCRLENRFKFTHREYTFNICVRNLHKLETTYRLNYVAGK